MTEEIKRILTEVRSTKGKYHSSEVSNEEIAKVILALIPQGDDEGLLTEHAMKEARIRAFEEHCQIVNARWKANREGTNDAPDFIDLIVEKEVSRAQQALTRQENEGLRETLDKARTEIAELSKKLDDREIDLQDEGKAEKERIFKDLEKYGVLAYHKGAFDSGCIESNDYYVLTIDSKWWQSLKGGSNEQ